MPGLDPNPIRPPLTESPSITSCAQRIETVLDEAPLGGTPNLESRRLEILARVKGEPVAFLLPPAAADAGEAVLRLRRRLWSTRHPWDLMQQILKSSRGDPATLRALTLRDGYLYAETPELAFALVDSLRADLLFSDPHIWVHRGGSLLHAQLGSDGRYVWRTGPETGKVVRLWLFDRVGSSLPPSEPRHLNIRGLRERLYFERTTLKHATRKHVVADIQYGSAWVLTLLSVRGAELHLECELATGAQAEALAALRARGARQQRVLAALFETIRAEIDEELPFDEPRTELGQQDGELRPAWKQAYWRGENVFDFNSDEYPVFDVRGRPLVPQVCTDFLIDTFERTGGKWWLSRGVPPGQSAGLLDLDRERAGLRSAQGFIQFAAIHPEWFELQVIPETRRLPLGEWQRLLQHFEQHSADYRPGDILVIFGWTPWDFTERHYHSVFVYEKDPLTGAPLWLAGNAGRPALRVWWTEAARTPKRSVVAHVRPRLEWLESFARPAWPAPAEVAPLVGSR